MSKDMDKNVNFALVMCKTVKISVIGGGAAGCFAAVCLKRALGPDAEVVLFEATDRLMSKLSRTGGGRCNITNTFEGVESLPAVYPRGENLMKRALKEFSPEAALEWFEREGLTFHVEAEGRVFPDSERAADVVDALRSALRREGVNVVLNTPVESLEGLDSDAVLLCCGGVSKKMGASLEAAGVKMVPCVPSLFTLKLASPEIQALSGLSVRGVTLGLAGTKFRATGDLLLTDWGISGPATLKLSSYAARHLAESGYKGELLVNWLSASENETLELLTTLASSFPKRLVCGNGPEGIPSRLWKLLSSQAGVRENATWAEMGTKGLRRLAAALSCSSFGITGKAAFKEEFVTCGGVDLAGLSLRTLESKSRPGWFFAGEALDVDAVTGGFNLQAAWSTAYVAVKGIEQWIRNSWKDSSASA